MASPSTPISQESHDLLVEYLQAAINQQGSWWRDKLERTDLLYYCMQADMFTQASLRARAEELGVEASELLEAPVIISQIDTAVATLVDTFLNGYPLMGVVASPDRRQEIEQVETLIGYYARESQWAARLKQFFRNATKYSISPLGLISRYGYDLIGELEMGYEVGTGKRKVTRNITSSMLPEIICPDPYNLLFDYRVPPNMLATQGDYVGYAEMLPMTSIKALTIAIATAHEGRPSGLMNLDKMDTVSVPHMHYYLHPQIIETAAPRGYWDIWIGDHTRSSRSSADPARYYYSNHGLLRRTWLRLVPDEFKLHRYGGKTPAVFEVWTLNDALVVFFAPVYLRDNSFPLGMVDIANEGFNYGGKSEVELFAPFQRAASTLLNAAVLGAERSVDDRAIFDPNFISQANLTRQSGSAYVPMTKSLAVDRDIRSIYHSVPYDASAAYAMPSLIRELVNTGQMLRGRNNFAQGLPQKGNRTLGEFSELMQNSDTRQSMPAGDIEELAFTPLKSWVKQWIGTNSTRETLLNHKSRRVVEIDPQTIADLQYDFQLATGYFSKKMLGSTDVLQMAFQVIGQSPVLQQSYDVASIFAYLLSLQGVKDMDMLRIQQQPMVPGAPDPNAPPGAEPPVVPAQTDMSPSRGI
jgi:hypothetical protein